MSKKQTKTNNSQQDNLRNCTLPKEDEGLRRSADIHNKTREQKLKEKLKQGDENDWCDDLEGCPCCISYELKGIKLGKQIREDEIIKIIDNVYIAYEWETRRVIHNIFIRLKQKIKGDEK